MLPVDLMPIIPGWRVPSRDPLPYQILSDSGSGSCSNPDDGSGGGCTGTGCSPGPVGSLPMAGMSVSYCGGQLTWPAGLPKPVCFISP